MGQFKDYEDLDEHPFTGLRKLSIFFPADIDGVKPLLFYRMRDTRRLRRTSRAALRT